MKIQIKSLRKQKSRLKNTLISALAFLGTFCTSADALTLVASRTDLNANDLLNWSSLGTILDLSDIRPGDFLPNTFSATSDGGIGIDIGLPLASSPIVTPPFVFETSSTAPTNFAAGDYVLAGGFSPGGDFQNPALGNGGPISLSFSRPILGAGTQLAVDDTFTYDLFVTAFDLNDNLLGTFSVGGTSSTALDNSAAFLGVISDTPNIARLVFRSSEPNRAIALNNLSLLSSVPVPEPSAQGMILILGIGGATVFLSKKSSS